MHIKKGKLLKALVYGFGILCLFLFTVTKIPFLMDVLTIAGNPYGNLYKNCRVTLFKIRMDPTKPPPATYNATPIDSCDLIVLGDSFVSECPGHHYFGVELAERLERPVYQLEIKPDLFYELNRSGISWMEKERIFLFETGESGIYKNFGVFPDMEPVEISSSEQIVNVQEMKPSLPMLIRKRWFIGTERNYSYFLKNNILIESLIDGYYTTLFHLFGKISQYTPVYSLDPPFLFESRSLGKQPTSFYFNHNDRFIDRMTDNIKTVADSLKALYNVHFVFMGIPDKYTLYHHFINDDPYDNYLPRLEQALIEKGVEIISLYDLYVESEDILYHPADNHWVSEGVVIALDETARVLEPLFGHR